MQHLVGVLCINLTHLLKSKKNDNMMQFGKQKMDPAIDERGSKLLGSSYGVLCCHKGVI